MALPGFTADSTLYAVNGPRNLQNLKLRPQRQERKSISSQRRRGRVSRRYVRLHVRSEFSMLRRVHRVLLDKSRRRLLLPVQVPFPRRGCPARNCSRIRGRQSVWALAVCRSPHSFAAFG